MIKLSEKDKIVVFIDGEKINLENLKLNEELSQSIFKREGKIELIEIFLEKNKS